MGDIADLKFSQRKKPNVSLRYMVHILTFYDLFNHRCIAVQRLGMEMHLCLVDMLTTADRKDIAARDRDQLERETWV